MFAIVAIAAVEYISFNEYYYSEERLINFNSATC